MVGIEGIGQGLTKSVANEKMVTTLGNEEDHRSGRFSVVEASLSEEEVLVRCMTRYDTIK